MRSVLNPIKLRTKILKMFRWLKKNWEKLETHKKKSYWKVLRLVKMSLLLGLRKSIKISKTLIDKSKIPPGIWNKKWAKDGKIMFNNFWTKLKPIRRRIRRKSMSWIDISKKLKRVRRILTCKMLPWKLKHISWKTH